MPRLVASFYATLQSCLSEAVGRTQNNSAIRVAHETQRSFFTNTMLINGLFGKIHAFNTKHPVIFEGVKQAGIKLSSVQCVNREAECAASACIGSATEVLCTESFTPCVTHSRGDIILLVVQGEVVSIFGKIKQTAFYADFAKDL